MVPNVHSPNVLVVEPYTDLRDGIVDTLQRLDYVCDSVATPVAATLKLHERDYDYVVLTVDAGGATDALVATLDAHRHVLLLTDDDPREMSAHDHSVLRKPFGRDELAAHFGR
jgi:DNA-binding response OmpR family regulator